MGVKLIGCGGGSDYGLTIEAVEAIKNSKLVVGSERILEELKGYIKCEALSVVSPDRQFELIEERIKADKDMEIAVLFSGDTGIFSGAQKVGKRLENAGIDYEVLPGISSFALMAAAMKKSYKDALLLSAHGREVDIIRELMKGRPIFALTDGKNNPKELCKRILEAGIPPLKACVGENLTYVNQKLFYGTVSEISRMDFKNPSILYLEPLPVYERKNPGIADEEFIRGDVPMTKQLVRAALMALLDLREGDVCWDIGAGTGSVSVEMALFASRVYAVERKAEAVSLIKKNRERFGAWNIKVIENDAKRCISELERPDKVFVGGSGGELEEVVRAALGKNPQADILINAVTVETLSLADRVLKKYERRPKISQIQVSDTVNTGNYSIFKAENPVFIIRG